MNFLLLKFQEYAPKPHFVHLFITKRKVREIPLWAMLFIHWRLSKH